MNRPIKTKRQPLPRRIKKNMENFLIDQVSKFPTEQIKQSISEWARTKRKIGAGLTAEPGPFDFEIAPYVREIVDNMSVLSTTQECYTIKGTQIGYTVGVPQNTIGYCIQHSIGPLLSVGGDQAMAEEETEKRLDEMIQNSGLSDKIKSNATKKTKKATGDRSDSKMYGGTFARFIGPSSEGKAASFNMKVLIMDEMDKYPIKLKQKGIVAGDIVTKLIRRTESYEEQRKILGGSSPKEKSTSRIEPLVESGDKRLYNVRCPRCDFQQPLLWSNFVIEKDENGKPNIIWENINGEDIVRNDPAYFKCANEECDHKFRYKDRLKILREKGYGGTAEWVPTKKADRPHKKSYKIPQWYGPRAWYKIALEWYDSKDDPFLWPEFVNDVMAETWQESDEKPDEHELLNLSREYELWERGHIKRNVLILVLAADIQKDRIEAGLMGWGRNKQGYQIDYWTFEGNTEDLEDRCWRELAEKINGTYTREDGLDMTVTVSFIDSQYRSAVVDSFCEGFDYSHNNVKGVYPTQSKDTSDKLAKEFKGDIKTPTIGLHDQKLKRALYGILRKRPHSLENFPNYYLHFSHEYGEEFYKQLTSEEIVTVTVKGEKRGFNIINTKNRRNEVLDIVKMQIAALEYAYDKFFVLHNNYLRSIKSHEIQKDIDLFFDAVENELY